ncbi:MAG TPA: tRNA glutamyl-Q(34) synthetase GluQRS [Steroidobacteraceae bacterium]|nr:tRNA glutamyl-Q(34) synthetase GluQRS [Steroidobacteraceae bacterium]
MGREPLRNTGRFAPSPTGPLHLGSLLAAMGSYLDARATGGRWLVRIEDLDTPRVIPGCADEQLRMLERFGFEWDGEILHQSARREAYRDAIARLGAMGRTFRCSCSRKDLAGAALTGDEAQGYPGTCRDGPTRPGPTSLRFRVAAAPIHFDDLYLGRRTFERVGDVVIERRDGLATYQLAVVVDDAHQSVTRVVRGADLLASTPWQIELQQALHLPRPIYGHLPLVTEPDGAKLSKSRRSLPLDLTAVAEALTLTLTHLYQDPPPELARASVKDVWNWAFAHWNPQALAGKTETRLSARTDSQADFTH